MYWFAHRSKWCVAISLSGKNKHVGYFDSEADAEKAYKDATRKLLGEASPQEVSPRVPDANTNMNMIANNLTQSSIGAGNRMLVGPSRTKHRQGHVSAAPHLAIVAPGLAIAAPGLAIAAPKLAIAANLAIERVAIEHGHGTRGASGIKKPKLMDPDEVSTLAKRPYNKTGGASQQRPKQPRKSQTQKQQRSRSDDSQLQPGTQANTQTRNAAEDTCHLCPATGANYHHYNGLSVPM